jgi:NAD(P)-dependent dehydrogenase (short-subunit alcohol dehydrogenase family)
MLEQGALDLASLDSVRAFASWFGESHDRLHLLINNAGVMYTDKAKTKDGFELQFGTNHLGHFALTGQLLVNMLAVDGSRVVTVSSVGHRIRARIHFEDLQLDNNYDRVVAYGQSKLANLLFTYELARRLNLKAAPTIATAAHPGAADTDLLRNMPGGIRQVGQFVWSTFIAQSADMGALPTLRAATDPGAKNAEYYGPGGFGEQRGAPKVVKSSAQSHDEDIQRRLWSVSEELTGVKYPV